MCNGSVRMKLVILDMCITLGIFLAAACAGADPGASGWRGNGSGVYENVQPPVTWSDKQNVRWSVEVGDSLSSPVVSGSRVFVTVQPAVLLCVDAATGKELWRSEHGAGKVPADVAQELAEGKFGSGNAAPTPAADGTHVYVQFASSLVACYDFQGRRKWVKAFGIGPVIRDGRSASPVLAGDKLLTQIGCLTALGAKTGEVLWRAKEAVEGYGTPLVTRLGGQDAAITPGGCVVLVENGKLLARKAAGLNFASPVLMGKTAFFIDSVAKALDLPENAGPFQPKPRWTQSPDGQFYASPIAHDGLIHAVSDGAKYYVLDARSGDILLEQDLPMPPAEEGGSANAIVFSSLCLAGGLLYVGNDHGDTLVLQPGKTFKLLSRNHLGSGTVSTPTFAGKCMYLRSGRKLYCIAKGETP
jgi:outer membrane protein assembly factor BamB